MSQRSLADLVQALTALGIEGEVEERAGLAILHPRLGLAPLADGDRRRQALDAARRCGFTHLAVDVTAARGTRAHDAGARPDAER